MTTISVTESQEFEALRAWMIEYLPGNVPVVRGQVNRVPQPASLNHIVVWPVSRKRYSSNKTEYHECKFTGHIDNDILTVESVDRDEIRIGSLINDWRVMPATAGLIIGHGGSDIYLVPQEPLLVVKGTFVTELITGFGGVGTYLIFPPQVVPSKVLHAGLTYVRQSNGVTIQIDVHGPDSGDYTQILTTLFHDDSAFVYFRRYGIDVRPLYCEDARQIPFVNGENQWENRWSIDVTLQVCPIIGIPQQFAGELIVNPVVTDMI